MLSDADRKKLDDFLGPDYALPYRGYDTEQDMMALYRKLWEKGKWEKFYCLADLEWSDIPENQFGSEYHDFDAWLFCLSGEGYEERCQMVADFIRKETA